MNMANPYFKQYKKNQIETATPEEILILLYDAAINYLNKANIALEKNDLESFPVHIQDCKNIIMEFMNSLDMEAGGEFAENLYGLYRYYHTVLVKAELSQQREGIDEVLGHLISLRETWLKAIDIAKAEKGQDLVDKYESSDKTESFEYYDDDEEEDEDE